MDRPQLGLDVMSWESPFVTHDDVKRIEKETGISLPQHYVDLVVNYPDELAETEAPDYGLLDDPDEVIRANRDVREQGYFGEQWPLQYFIIGQNGCGDYYVILHEGTAFSVGFADHEIMACNRFANTREEFIEKLLKEIAE